MHVQTLRYESALELGDVAPDVDVRCTDTTLGGQHLAFSKASLLPPSKAFLVGHMQQPVTHPNHFHLSGFKQLPFQAACMQCLARMAYISPATM